MHTQLAHQPQPQSRPHPTHTKREYMILLQFYVNTEQVIFKLREHTFENDNMVQDQNTTPVCYSDAYCTLFYLIVTKAMTSGS